MVNKFSPEVMHGVMGHIRSIDSMRSHKFVHFRWLEVTSCFCHFIDLNPSKSIRKAFLEQHIQSLKRLLCNAVT
jgi:hypothetical protein